MSVRIVKIAGHMIAAIAVDRPAARAARRRIPIRKRARSQRLPEAMVGQEDDRVVVDSARTAPALGNLLVLWNGDGLVPKPGESMRGSLAHGPGFAPETLHAASGSWRAERVGIVLIRIW